MNSPQDVTKIEAAKTGKRRGGLIPRLLVRLLDLTPIRHHFANPLMRGLFGTLVRQAGRDDLLAELRSGEQPVVQVPLPPPSPAVHELFGKASRLTANKHYKAAIRVLHEALEIAPDDIPCLVGMGLSLAMDRRPAEAEGWFLRAIEIQPAIAESHLNLGNCLREQGKSEQALAAYRRSLTLNPRSYIANYNLGLLLDTLERLREAEGCFRWALDIEPNNPHARTALGLLLLRMRRPAEAEAVFRRILELDPRSAGTYTNLGVALEKQGREPEALEMHRKALEIDPKMIQAQLNISNTLIAMNRLDEAITHARRALALNAAYVPAMVNLGAAETFRGNFGPSEQWYRKALALAPDDVLAHWNLANILLRQGHYPEGFREYEWRWQWPDFPSEKRNFPQPLWTLDMPKSTRLLIHAEQGWGDTLQFLRFVPAVTALGYAVTLEIQPPLLRLARLQNFCPTVGKGDALPPVDAQCPLWTTALVLGTKVDTIPGKPPFLKADPHEIQQWRKRRDDRLTVGLVWAGKSRPDPTRTVGLKTVLPLLDEPGIRFVSLQKDLQPGDAEIMAGLGDRLSPWAEDFNDFADTAAALSVLDLVISIDTGVTHLAGALDLPVWVMIRVGPDWRWGTTGETMPWYPSARIFRQDAAGDWSGVIERIRPELARLASGDRSVLPPAASRSPQIPIEGE